MPRKLSSKALQPSVVQDQISNLVDSAPEALDTLNELAAALGDDANFATTVTNSLAGKQATLVSGTNIKTINNTSLLGSGDITISASAQTTMPVTATSGNNNLKIPFLDTTSNSTGNYAFLQDSSSNFTYNPATNTLNNVTLGSSVSFSSGLPAASVTSLGAVYGSTSTSGKTHIGYGINDWGWSDDTSIGAYSAAGQYGAAVGYQAEAFGKYSVVIGYNSHAGQSHYDPSHGTIIIGSGVSVNSGASKTIYLRAKDWTAGSSPDVQVAQSGFYVDPITSGTSGNVLYYDSNTKKITYGTAPSGGGGGALGDLSDVTISNPTSGQALLYNGTAWVNGTIGEEPPVQQDVFRSTKIVPVNVFRNGSYTTIITFSSAAEANYVRNFLIKISTTFTNQGGSKFVRFAQSSGYGNQIDIDSNFQGWSNVSGSTLSINNYYVNEPSYPGGGIRVGYYYPDQITITPDNKLVIGTGNIDSLVTLNPAWSPHGIEVYNPNVSGMATRIIPASSPSLTPAIREYTSPSTSIIEFTLDLDNNPPQQVNPFNGIGYVAFILGKYELVDPNAPEPWYTVQDGTTNQLNGQISVPSGFNAQTFGQYDKLVLIGNAPYNSSQYFYPFNSFNNGPSIGSSSQNNQTRTFFTRNPSTDPFIGYGYFSQNRGLVAAFAQPLPSSTSTVTGMVQGDDSYSNFDGRGFFRSNSSAYLTNSNLVALPPPGGTVKLKAVMVFTQPVEVAIFSGYASATGTLLETFTYQDYDWGSITRFVFFTCTNDTIARQMCSDPQPILQFSQSPGGLPFSVDHLVWAWWERTL